MKTRLIHKVAGCLAVVLIAGPTPGCRKEKQAQKEPPKEQAEAEKDVDTDKTAAVEVKLAKADAFDGQADKIVSKCPGCALEMDGTSEHALGVSGYTIHFCSEDCKTGFEQDATKAVLAMNIPED